MVLEPRPARVVVGNPGIPTGSAVQPLFSGLPVASADLISELNPFLLLLGPS